MISGLATVVDYAKMTAREVSARIHQLTSRLRPEDSKAAPGPRTLILLSGKFIRDVKPDSPEFVELIAQRGSIFIGTYDFSVIEADKWGELEQQISKDAAAAHREYHEGRYTRPPNAPGEELPACIHRRRKPGDA
jgi:hypothetical protein